MLLCLGMRLYESIHSAREGSKPPSLRKRWSHDSRNRTTGVVSGCHGNLSKAGQLWNREEPDDWTILALARNKTNLNPEIQWQRGFAQVLKTGTHSRYRSMDR